MTFWSGFEKEAAFQPVQALKGLFRRGASKVEQVAQKALPPAGYTAPAAAAPGPTGFQRGLAKAKTFGKGMATGAALYGIGSGVHSAVSGIQPGMTQVQ